MLSVRLVKVDHYMSAPLPTLDVLYSEFRGSEVKHVPVIRIFGPTPSGEKACVHVHGVFPYFYVPYDASEPCERLMYQLSSALDKALNISLGKGNSSNQHVFKVALVSGIPFYGYHSKEHQFLKIYLYNPLLIKKASEVLQNGVILDKVFQPHEVHIPYALQFMIDYNLFGMSYANFERVKFRQVIDTDDNENAVHIPEELLLPAEIARISTCQHEVDVIASDILNRKLISGGGVSAAVNPGLAGIWEDEKQRRREEGRSSQITPQLSQSRPLLIPTDSELFYKQRLKERLVSLQSQATLTESHRSDEKDVSYPAETPPAKHLINASFIDDHVATAASCSPELNNSLLFDDVPVVNEDLMLNMSSSSPAASPFSSQFDSQDQQLVQLLQALDADDGKDVDDDSILGSQILKMGNVEDEEECDYDLTQPLHLENVDLEVSGIKSSSCGTETLPQSSADVWESSYWDSADSEIPQLDGANDDSDADDQGPLKYNSKPLSGNPGMESFSSSYSICNGNYKYGTFGTTYECFETVCNDSSLQSVLPFGEYYSGDSQTIYSLQHSSIMNTPESETMDIPDLADLSQFCENSPHELPFGVDDCSLCDNIGVDNSQNELDNTDLRDISDCSELQIDKYLSDIDPPCLHDRFSKVLMGDPPFFAKDFSDKDSDINKNNLDSVLDKSLDRVDDNFLEFLPYMTPNDDVNDTRDEFNIDNLESADSNVIPFTDDSAFQVKSEDVFPLEEKPDIDFMNEAFTIESSIPPIFEMAPLSDSEIEKPIFPALDVNIQLPTRESVKRGRRKYSKSAVQKGTVTCSKRKVITDKSSTSYLLRQKDKKSECEASAGRRGNRRKKDEAITKPSDTLVTTCSLNLADVDSGRLCVNSKRTKIPSAKTDRKSSFNTFASVTYEPQILCDASMCSTSADFDEHPVTERRKRKLEHFDDVNETSSLHTNKRSKKSTKVHEVTCYSNSKSSNYSNISTESRATSKTCSDEYDPYAFSDDVDSDISLCTVPSSSKGTFVVSKDKNFKRYSRRCYENKGKSNRRGAATSLTMLQNNTQNNCNDGLIDELNKFVNSVPNSSVESNLELRTPLHEYFNKCSSQPRVVIKRYASVANLRVASGRSKNEFPDDRSDVHRRRQRCHARKSQCSSDNSDESIEMKSYKKFPSSQSEESTDMVHVPKLKIKRVSSNEYVSISQDSALVSSISTRSEENISVDCVLRADPLRENRASVVPSLKSLCSNICSRFTNNNEPLTAVNSEVIKCCGSTEQIAESAMNEFSVHCEHNNRFVSKTTDIEKSNSFVTDTDCDYQITTGTENVSKVKRCIIKGKTNIPESGHVARSNSCNFNDRVNTKSSRTFSRSVSQVSSKEVEESDSYDSYWPRVPSARRVLRNRGFSTPVGRSLRPRKKVNYSESSIKESRTDIHSLKCSKEVLSLLKPLSIKVKPLTISELRKYNITIPNKDPLIKDAKTQRCTYVSSDSPSLFEPGSSASSVYKNIPCLDGAADSSSSDEESFSDSSILSCKSGKTNNNNRVKNLKHDNHSSRSRVSDDSSKATSPKFNFESTKKLIRSPTKSLLKVKICSSPKRLSPKNKSDVLTSQPEKKRHELKDTSVMENKNLQKGKLKRIEVDSSECRQSYETKYSKLKSALSSEESAVSSRGHAEHTNGGMTETKHISGSVGTCVADGIAPLKTNKREADCANFVSQNSDGELEVFESEKQVSRIKTTFDNDIVYQTFTTNPNVSLSDSVNSCPVVNCDSDLDSLLPCNTIIKIADDAVPNSSANSNYTCKLFPTLKTKSARKKLCFSFPLQETRAKSNKKQFSQFLGSAVTRMKDQETITTKSSAHQDSKTDTLKLTTKLLESHDKANAESFSPKQIFIFSGSSSNKSSPPLSNTSFEKFSYVNSAKKSTLQGKKVTNIFIPSRKTPTGADISRDLAKFGYPECKVPKPFYSNVSDVTGKKEVGSVVLKIPGRSLSELQQFQTSLSDIVTLEKWREQMFSDLNMSQNQCVPNTCTRIENFKESFCSGRLVIITPAIPPPTPRDISLWVKAKKILEQNKCEKEIEVESKKRHFKAVIPLSPGDNVDSDSELSLTINSPDSVCSSPCSETAAVNPSPTLMTRDHSTPQNNDSPIYSSPVELTPVIDSNRKLQLMNRDADHAGIAISDPRGSASKSNKSSVFEEGDTSSDKEDVTLTKLSPQSQISADDPSLRKVLLKSQFHNQFITPKGPKRRLSSSFQIGGCSLNNTHGFKMSFENLQEGRSLTEHQYLTVLTMDVHVQTRGDFKPDPAVDPIQAVFYFITNDVPDRNTCIKREECGVIVVQPPGASNFYLEGTGLDVPVTYVSDEKKLLTEVETLVKRTDPDILAGYEIEMLSWGFLFQRAYSLGVNLCPLVSRIPSSKKDSYAVEEDEQIGRTDTDIHIAGRIVLNMWRLMRHEIALQSYTFENVMFHVLHQRVPLYSFRRLTQWWDCKALFYRCIVVEYYLLRVKGIMKIMDQLDLINRTSELARLFGIQFYEVLSRGSQFRVESMMLRMAKPLNFVPVSPSIQQRAKMRAPECLQLIMEPESRFYSDPVIVLDFQSLYPSMIIAYNYCFSTCLGRVEHLGQEGPFEFGCTKLKLSPSEVSELENHINVSPSGVAFVKHNVRRGILPQMLEEILNTRLMVKKSMKEHKNNKLLQRILHARQLGLKLIANVTYGYTAANFSGRMPCVEVADSVVSKGRETLERAINLVENTPKWGAKVVYGDTDSLFVLVEGRSREQAFKIGSEIADAVTKENPKPVKLKLEKVYQPCLLQTKKRYVGYMYESPEQVEPVYDAKGIETVRRDGCPAVAKILEKSLRILFESSDVSQVKSYVCHQFSKILQGHLNIQDLIFAKEYRGISGYKPGACVPALELAKKWLETDKRSEPRVRERVPYVVVNGPPGLPLIRLVRSPSELMIDPSLRINALYYITKAIIPPLNRCFSLLGADVDSWFADMPRKYLPSLPSVSNVTSKKSTISQYFATMNCACCEQLTNAGLCSSCQAQPQKAALCLSNKIRTWDRLHSNIRKMCQSCCGHFEPDHCVSLDCSFYFQRNLTSRDLSQVPFLQELEDRFLKF